MSGEAHPGVQPQISDLLLESGGLSVDRLTLLKVVVDRLAGACADGIRQLTSAPIYMLTKDISGGRVGQILEPYLVSAVCNVYYVAEWDARLLIGVDAGFVSSLLEVLFGGDGSEPPPEQDRPLTNIEVKVAQKALDVAAVALKSAFGSVMDLTFAYERMEAKIEFAIAGRRNQLAILARIGLQIFDREGDLFVVIPQQAVNPLRQVLDQDALKAPAASDPLWARQFESELARTRVRLSAVVDVCESTLGEIGAWRVGDLISLPSLTGPRVRLECEGQSIFSCELGRTQERYTVRLADPLEAGAPSSGAAQG